jgi:hypothetical protein
MHQPTLSQWGNIYTACFFKAQTLAERAYDRDFGGRFLPSVREQWCDAERTIVLHRCYGFESKLGLAQLQATRDQVIEDAMADDRRDEQAEMSMMEAA